MAIKLQNKVNVLAPGGAYPFGNIKDDTGVNDGTPVDVETYGDFHQWFAYMLSQGVSWGGLVVNGLPDNQTNGFQYAQAFETWARFANLGYFSRVVESMIGVTPSLGVPYALLGCGLSGSTLVGSTIAAGYVYFDGQLYSCGGWATPIVNNAVYKKTSETGITIIADSATIGSGDFFYTDLIFYQPFNPVVTNPNKLITKVFNITSWDMDSVTTITVAHGLADFNKIRSVQVMIRDNANTIINPLDFGSNTVPSGAINIGATDITLRRNPGGLFDSASYNAAVGWVTIMHAP